MSVIRKTQFNWAVRLSPLALVCASTAHAFTLLDFPSSDEINTLGRYARWFYGSDWFGSGAEDSQAITNTFVLSYRVDDSFLLSEGNLAPGEGAASVESALQTWSDATGGRMVFQEAPWAATSNAGPATSDNNFFDWEGPGYDEWLADWNSGNPVYGLDTLPGWGANIEVFSRPTGFALNSNGVDYLMTNGILGFAVINRTTPNNTRIASVDLYLNERWTWTTDGSGTGAGGNFDIETVVLHELGHAMGLDHPNETIDGGCTAVCNDSPNFDPRTLQTGSPLQADAAMQSDFSTIRRSISDDERGGLAYLYPPLPGDINGDFVVNGTDIAYSIADSVGILSLDPYSLRAADFINVDGAVGIVETTKIIRDVHGLAQRQAPFANPNESPTFSEREVIVKENAVVPITTWCVPSPADAGLGGRIDVEVSVDIPYSAESQSYSFDIAFDPTVFQNPRVVEYNPSPGSSFVWEIVEPGTIRIRRNGISDTTFGQVKLATIILDADFAMAVASAGPLFTLDGLEFVPLGSDPPRLYGDGPDESVVLIAIPMHANDYDVTRDGVIDIDDLFAWYTTPMDVDRDGAVDIDDVRALEAAIRLLEEE